jgi:hypothetical protein
MILNKELRWMWKETELAYVTVPHNVQCLLGGLRNRVRTIIRLAGP